MMYFALIVQRLQSQCILYGLFNYHKRLQFCTTLKAKMVNYCVIDKCDFDAELKLLEIGVDLHF